MQQTTWQEKLKAQLAQHEEQSIPTKDLRFYHVDTLLRYAGHTERYAGQCAICRTNMQEIENVVSRLPEFLEGHTVGRKTYEQYYTQLESHLKQEHRLETKNYKINLFRFYGMLIGILFGMALGKWVDAFTFDKAVLISWLIGLLVGQLWGRRKEKELEEEARYL